MKTRILASFRQSLMKNALLFFFGTTMLASYHYVKAAYGDIDDYYTLADTEGPFAVTAGPGGTFVRGQDTASFAAGQVVGWTSAFCAVPGRPFSGTTSMVRLSQDGLREQPIATRTTHFPGDQLRCGPRVYGLRVPDDAVPGLYELRRELAFREGSLWPLHARLPVVAFRVVGAPAAEQNAAGE